MGRVIRTNVRAKDKTYTGDKSPRGIIVRTKEGMMRKDGSRIRFDDNSFVVIANNKPKGTKIKGPLPYEVRHSVRNLSKWVF
jgi:ribosomal protein L14